MSTRVVERGFALEDLVRGEVTVLYLPSDQSDLGEISGSESRCRGCTVVHFRPFMGIIKKVRLSQKAPLQC